MKIVLLFLGAFFLFGGVQKLKKIVGLHSKRAVKDIFKDLNNERK